MGFSRQEHQSGLLCSPPGDLPDPGIEPTSLMSPAMAGGFFTMSTTWQAFAINRSLLVTYFIYSCLYMSVPISQFITPHLYPWASLVAQLVKNLSAGQETLFQFQGQEDLLEKGETIHSGVLGLPWWLRQ